MCSLMKSMLLIHRWVKKTTAQFDLHLLLFTNECDSTIFFFYLKFFNGDRFRKKLNQLLNFIKGHLKKKESIYFFDVFCFCLLPSVVATANHLPSHVFVPLNIKPNTVQGAGERTELLLYLLVHFTFLLGWLAGDSSGVDACRTRSLIDKSEHFTAC